MTRKGIDYAWGRPGGAAIAAAGYTFAVRYVDYPGAQGKGLTADELADLQRHGIAVVLVFESTANRALGGVTAGAYDAGLVHQQLQKLVWPAGRPVYFAVDFDAQPSQFIAIDQYLAGAASVLGGDRVGVYGSYAVVKHCRAVDSAQWFWQSLAWSGGQLFDGRHLYQYRSLTQLAGVDIDEDEAAQDDFGQWEAQPVAQAQEEDMVDAALKQQVDDLNAAATKRFQIIALAGGDYQTMLKAWDALKAGGFVS